MIPMVTLLNPPYDNPIGKDEYARVMSQGDTYVGHADKAKCEGDVQGEINSLHHALGLYEAAQLVDLEQFQAAGARLAVRGVERRLQMVGHSHPHGGNPRRGNPKPGKHGVTVEYRKGKYSSAPYSKPPKWAADEYKWNRAYSQTKANYQSLYELAFGKAMSDDPKRVEKNRRKFFSITTTIYKSMKGRIVRKNHEEKKMEESIDAPLFYLMKDGDEFQEAVNNIPASLAPKMVKKLGPTNVRRLIKAAKEIRKVMDSKSYQNWMKKVSK